MADFKTPAWRTRHINDKDRRQNRVASGATTAMEKIMRDAIDVIVDSANTGEFVEPAMHDMGAVMAKFYRSVISEAFISSKKEKAAQEGKKRLAAYNSPIVPKLRDLEMVFRDKRFWPSMMKRSEKLTDRLRKAYLQKLRRKFKDLLPQILDGRISPEIAKKRMMDAWFATKSRVETIFRTETTKYFTETQVAFFKNDPEIIGFLFDSIKDKASTEICKTRHGLIYRPDSKGTKGLAYNTPALHWNCRSHLIALANTPYNRRMLAEKQRDPERRSVAPLPTGWKRKS